jgi:hypothetical protein
MRSSNSPDVAGKAAMRDELAARAKRRKRQSREGRLTEARRQIDRLAVRLAGVQEQLAHAVDAGDETEHLDAEVAWITQRQTDLENYLRSARNDAQ